MEQERELTLEEKEQLIRETAEKINCLIGEDYKKVKFILEKSPAPTEPDFTLTVGIQNAYLG